MIGPLTIAYRGNFGPAHSTESHVSASMEELGHRVLRLQENEVPWDETVKACEGADVFWWTQTWGYALEWDQAEAMASIEKLNSLLPTVGFHLDLFIGLAREADHLDPPGPFFRTRYLFTADGAHDQRWAELGINHRWSPPGVYGAECVPGRRNPRFRSEVAFVGNWTSYHDEHPDRLELVNQLRNRYRRHVQFWPQPGQHAVRGQALNDLYASVKVIVGDSCFGGRLPRYWSDRIPETLGRGGVLVHPAVEGMEPHFTPGVHLATFPPGDWNAMFEAVDRLLDDGEARDRMRQEGHVHAKAHHTYRRRVAWILDTLSEESAWSLP